MVSYTLCTESSSEWKEDFKLIYSDSKLMAKFFSYVLVNNKRGYFVTRVYCSRIAYFIGLQLFTNNDCRLCLEKT